MTAKWIRPMFWVAALYDLALGAAFLLAWRAIYAGFGVAPPNHPAYVQFAAAVVAIFGIGFGLVAQAPQRNRDLILLGILFKLAYVITVLSYWVRGQIPGMWVPFAWSDLAFALVFAAALTSLAKSAPAAA